MNKELKVPKFNPGTIVIKKWSEIEPPVFTEVPGVMEDLGLSEQAEAMMEEQNRMIQMKHQIMVALTEDSSVFDTDEAEPAKDPFDFTVTEVPSISMIKRQRMENARNISAFYNQQYRECAKSFLTDAIPAVKDKKEKLQKEIGDLQLELNSLRAQYIDQIRQKKDELNKLMSGSKEVINRFYLTDKGSAIDGGFLPCENPEGVEWGTLNSLYNRYEMDEYLEHLKEIIDRIDDPEEGPSVTQTVKPVFRDVTGSGTPEASNLKSSSDGNGLKDFVKSIFS